MAWAQVTVVEETEVARAVVEMVAEVVVAETKVAPGVAPGVVVRAEAEMAAVVKVEGQVAVMVEEVMAAPEAARAGKGTSEVTRQSNHRRGNGVAADRSTSLCRQRAAQRLQRQSRRRYPRCKRPSGCAPDQ